MQRRFLFVVPFLLVLFIAAACSAPPPPAPTGAPPTAAPAATFAPTVVAAAPKATAIAPGPSSPGVVPPSVNAQRMIIKNAKFLLTVANTDSGVDRLTGVTTDMGGYVISVRTFVEDGLKAATLTFAVPVDRFEETLRRVRAIAIKVDDESASGEDVTDQYVDLESQLRNLQATSNRIRDFLSKAQNVDEALKVNAQLADVEKQIETVKGRLNYIGGRAAFSTLTVDLREQRATPTPTPTPTPGVWHPEQTLKAAMDAQTTLLQRLTDLAIWVIVVLLPYAIVAAIGAWVFMRAARWVNRRMPPPGPGPEKT